MATDVSISKSYYDTLLRRAGFSTSSDDVTIPKNVYNDLLRMSHEYESLRRALLGGGVSGETLDLVTSREAHGRHGDFADGIFDNCSSLFQKPASKPIRMVHPHLWSSLVNNPAFGSKKALQQSFQPQQAQTFLTRDQSIGNDQDQPELSWQPPIKHKDSQHFFETYRNHDPDQGWTEMVQQPKISKSKHTLLLSNLPQDVTHWDVTRHVRGGRLIDIWIRRNEQKATVTFAEGAADFMSFARRQGVYIGSRRIHVDWSERQYAIPQHIISKLANGVSRNLVVRGGASKLSEEQIREDMDHIHNLVIIAIVHRDQDIYVSTNSVNNAMFARSCMSSRAAYKGLRIDWYPDECTEPIPQKSIAASKAKPQTAAPSPDPNRFNLLNVDDEEDCDRRGGSSSEVSGVNLKPRSNGTGNLLD